MHGAGAVLTLDAGVARGRGGLGEDRFARPDQHGDAGEVQVVDQTGGEMLTKGGASLQ